MKILKSLFGEELSKKDLKLLKINYLIIILLFIFSGVMLKFIPADMPMQWGQNGSVNYTLPSIIGVWIAPIILFVVNLSFKSQKKINVLNTIILVTVSIAIACLYIYLGFFSK